MTAAANQWLIEHGKRRTGELWVVCVPFAGGGASVYASWAALLPPHVRLFGLQLPGRENRISEPALADMAEVLNAAGPALAEALREPFMLLGHSAGAPMAFALTHWLADQAGLEACKLLASASPAPHASGPWLHDLPDQELRQQLAAMGGTPAELLAHQELMELLTPTLRADLRVVETYCSNARLHCPIAAFGGSADRCTTHQQLLQWQAHTLTSFSLTMVPGDHFFIREPSLVMPYLVRQMSLD